MAAMAFGRAFFDGAGKVKSELVLERMLSLMLKRRVLADATVGILVLDQLVSVSMVLLLHIARFSCICLVR